MIDIECAHVTACLGQAEEGRKGDVRETKMLQRTSVDVNYQEGAGTYVIRLC